MPITITTPDYDFAEDLEKSAPNGISVTVRERMTRSVDAPQLFIVILEFIKHASYDLEVALVATWLCQKCNGKPCHIKDGGKSVTPKEDIIRRRIQEEFDFVHNKKSDNQNDG